MTDWVHVGLVSFTVICATLFIAVAPKRIATRWWIWAFSAYDAIEAIPLEMLVTSEFHKFNTFWGGVSISPLEQRVRILRKRFLSFATTRDAAKRYVFKERYFNLPFLTSVDEEDVEKLLNNTDVPRGSLKTETVNITGSLSEKLIPALSLTADLYERAIAPAALHARANALASNAELGGFDPLQIARAAAMECVTVARFGVDEYARRPETVSDLFVAARLSANHSMRLPLWSRCLRLGSRGAIRGYHEACRHVMEAWGSKSLSVDQSDETLLQIKGVLSRDVVAIASLVQWSLIHLATLDAESSRRLNSELNGVFGGELKENAEDSDVTPTFQQMTMLTNFLGQIVRETLRLHPVAPIHDLALTRNEFRGVRVDPLAQPPCEVRFDLLTYLRRRDLFGNDPDAFLPKRWGTLDATQAEREEFELRAQKFARVERAATGSSRPELILLATKTILATILRGGNALIPFDAKQKVPFGSTESGHNAPHRDFHVVVIPADELEIEEPTE